MAIGASAAAGTHEARLHELRDRTLRSIDAVGTALQAVDLPVSPQLTRSVQAAENAWREIDAEFGLLTSAEVGGLLGSRSKAARNVAGERHRDGRLLGVRRGNATRFPGFQFDGHGQLRPVVARLREIAAEYGWSEASLIIWLCTANGRLEGGRPVDLIGTDDEALTALTHESLATQW